jgi:hypothetical protein
MLLVPLPAAAVDLSPKTVAAFDKYVQIAERRISAEVEKPDTFLWADTPAGRKADALARLRRGEVVVEKLRLDGSTDVPDGLLHHWVGLVFIPGVHQHRTRGAVRESWCRPVVQRAPQHARERSSRRGDADRT